jgi:peptidoglycan/xylan/chitin deacetylase (PgdA/CDA1 family)
MRGLVKTGVSRALEGTGVDRWIGALSGRSALPLVIGYHRVVERFPEDRGNSIPSMLISQRMLERQLDWIGQRFRFVSLDELGSGLEGSGFDDPVAAITFDDGYQDVYENAFPLLKKKGIPAAVFVVTDLAGTSEPQIHDRLYLLLERLFQTRPAFRLDSLLSSLGIHHPEIINTVGNPYKAMGSLMSVIARDAIRQLIEALEAEIKVDDRDYEEFRSLSWDMIAEMQTAGMTIGSHTKSHVLLSNEKRGTVLDEIAGSRQELEKRLGITVKHFAYPDGRFNISAVSAVAASGYRYAYTTCYHRDRNHPLLTIPRRVFWENSCLDALGRFSPAIMSCNVNRVFDLVSPCGKNHGWRVDNVLVPQETVKQVGTL